MRLIDTDEILTRIQKAYVDTNLGTNKRAVAINIGLTRALNMVQDCKKIELKRGKWKEYPIAEDCYQCSECGVLRMGISNFCPNCGARMVDDDIS